MHRLVFYCLHESSFHQVKQAAVAVILRSSSSMGLDAGRFLLCSGEACLDEMT